MGGAKQTTTFKGKIDSILNVHYFNTESLVNIIWALIRSCFRITLIYLALQDTLYEEHARSDIPGYKLDIQVIHKEYVDNVCILYVNVSKTSTINLYNSPNIQWLGTIIQSHPTLTSPVDSTNQKEQQCSYKSLSNSLPIGCNWDVSFFEAYLNYIPQ